MSETLMPDGRHDDPLSDVAADRTKSPEHDRSPEFVLREKISQMENEIASLKQLMASLGATITSGLPDKGTAPSLSSSKEVNGVAETTTRNATSSDSETLKAIRWICRDAEGRKKETEWHDPRKPNVDDGQKPPYKLTVVKVVDEDRETYEITISDIKLRDLIRTLLSPYVAHTGKNTWQQPQVTLGSNFGIIVLNFRQLEAHAQASPQDPTCILLREFLDIVCHLVDPLLLLPPGPDSVKDFRISYAHLWSLYGPGKLVVSLKHGIGDPQVFRIHRIENYELEARGGFLAVYAWIWDWDGTQLIRTMYEFRIRKYDETKAPKELDCYPIEFYEDEKGLVGTDAIRAFGSIKDRRRLFLKYTVQEATKVNVWRYHGDAFGDTAAFSDYDSLEANQLKSLIGFFSLGARKSERPERKLVKIEEDIVLDQQNYLRRVGNGRLLGSLEPVLISTPPCKCDLCMGEETKKWHDKIGAIKPNEDKETLKKKIKEALDFCESENDLLLPPRVFGFALNKKDWCQFSMDKIRGAGRLKITKNGAQLEGLILPSQVNDNERQDIFKLVSRYTSVMEKSKDERVADSIGGKGDSLILLFHGHSGTGKTLYAESLANSCGKVLFKVGTSDIGLDAGHAERCLKEIFELAQSWGAILLIDEADVLLDARGKENEGLMSKNALVSVLLREVEYFRGILIMTTNRVRAFDPAILSRIHHAVDFEKTTAEQELAIWQLWHGRLREQNLWKRADDILKWMKDTNDSKSRNRGFYLSGREIRNVLLVAQCLAESEGQSICISRKHLDRAYNYKYNFLQDTEEKMRDAQHLVMTRQADRTRMG